MLKENQMLSNFFGDIYILLLKETTSLRYAERGSEDQKLIVYPKVKIVPHSCKCGQNNRSFSG